MKKVVKIIDEITGNTEELCNKYLSSLPNCKLELVDVQSHYNTILGVVIFVIVHPDFNT